jgi:ubiquinone/menaquinone biosynthesis C-methylase UbiE
MSLNNLNKLIDNEILICLNCKKPYSILSYSNKTLVCKFCEQVYRLEDERIFVANQSYTPEFFDKNHSYMSSGNDLPEIQELCYRIQRMEKESTFKPNDVILDVGCGPSVCYTKPQTATLIGVEPSYNSIKLNTQLDFAVCGSASNLPLASRSVDCVVFFYSIHHMNSGTIAENEIILRNILEECARVTKADGRLIIYDMDPWIPFSIFQDLSWNALKNYLKEKLDMYFWRESKLKSIACSAFRAKSFTKLTFRSSGLLTFSPIFSLPNFKVPRFLYPFQVKRYEWVISGDLD